MKRLFRRRYRIVKDGYSGFEVQIKRWWLPFAYFQCHAAGAISNTHRTIEKARHFIADHRNHFVVEFV